MRKKASTNATASVGWNFRQEFFCCSIYEISKDTFTFFREKKNYYRFFILQIMRKHIVQIYEIKTRLFQKFTVCSISNVKTLITNVYKQRRLD